MYVWYRRKLRMNDYETIYNNNPLDNRVAINTANLVTYIKKEMNMIYLL